MPTFENIQEEIASMLSIPDEELSEEQRAAMNEYLDMLGTQEAGKVDAFAQFLRIQSAHAKACKDESQRLATKARTAEKRIDWIKGKYLATMQEYGLKKIQGNSYTLSVRQSEVVVVPADLSALEENSPELIRRIEKIEPDKVAIKAALKAGKEVPGCQLQPSYSLQVR